MWPVVRFASNLDYCNLLYTGLLSRIGQAKDENCENIIDSNEIRIQRAHSILCQ